MKWYFAMNSASLDRYRDMISVAVRTALDRTSLQPNFLFDGEPCSYTEELRALGVTVHYRASSFAAELDARVEKDGYKASTARGAYLRLEIPTLETENTYVLYTDVDVMFLRDFDWASLRPKIVMASGEYDSSKEVLSQSKSVFNSGVMIVNVPAFRDVLPEFADFIRSKEFYFHGNGGFYDQGAINMFFGNKIEPLPNSLNYRVFSGMQEDPVILHFHGPKPSEIERCIAGDSTVYPILRELYARNPEGYRHYLATFKSLLSVPTTDKE